MAQEIGFYVADKEYKRKSEQAAWSETLVYMIKRISMFRGSSTRPPIVLSQNMRYNRIN